MSHADTLRRSPPRSRSKGRVRGARGREREPLAVPVAGPGCGAGSKGDRRRTPPACVAALDQVAIDEALVGEGGNESRAAARLAISERPLRSALAKHRQDPEASLSATISVEQCARFDEKVEWGGE